MSDRLSIPPERDLPEGQLQRRKEHLVSEIVLGDTAARKRRRRLSHVLVPAVLLALAATGFTTYVLTREPTQLESVGCYTRADLEANVSVVAADGRDPVAICAEVLRTTIGPTAGGLEACVLEGGAVGVFPGGPRTCSRLGLAEVPDSYSVESKRFARLREAILARLDASGPCVGEAKARSIVRRELDAQGYRDWEIEVGPGVGGEGFSEERPCASVAFDGEKKVVVLVPDVG